jgi:hypothetical protein
LNNSALTALGYAETKPKHQSFTVVSNTNPGLPLAASLLLNAGAVS